MECAACEEQDAHALQMLGKPFAGKDTIGKLDAGRRDGDSQVQKLDRTA